MPRHPEFPLQEGLIYLNHAAVAPWPRRTVEAVQAFAAENGHRGAADYPSWNTVETRLRQRLQRLIGAPSADDVGLLKSTSEGLSVIAHGLDWREGDNVVISDQEFPSNRIVWESLARYGVETRRVDLTAAATPEEAMSEACDRRTRLLSVSSVQYATGLRMDLETLGASCRRRGILFCVDAIQSLGALRLDAETVGADFVVADGHKWMLGPEGIALFYVRPKLRERLQLHQYGWHMVEHMGDFDRSDWQPAASARRFECGSPNMLGIHGLEASLSLLEETGMAAVEEAVLERSGYLHRRCLEAPDLEVVTPGGRLAGIVTVRSAREDARTLHQRLNAAGVVCIPRGGGVRLSPHFYTPWGDMEKAVETLLMRT